MADANRTKSYTLEVGKHLPAEQWARRGKPESGAHVHIEMSLDRALELAQRIIAHTLDRRNRGEVFEDWLLGELREEPDE